VTLTQSTDLWTLLTGAEDAQTYCTAWLALQCRQIQGVRAALLLLEEQDKTFVPAAVWPGPGTDVTHLGETAQRCLTERAGCVDNPEAGARFQVGYPLEHGGRLLGAVVLDLQPRKEAELQEVLRTLHWGTGRLEVVLLERQLDEHSRSTGRSQVALELAALVGEKPRLEEAAMVLVNEIATRLDCERVALGLERRGRIRLQALSHAAWFEKKSEFVLALENAMEEAVDQQRTVVLPPLPGRSGTIAVAHRNLAKDGSVCTVVLTVRGRGIGALTCQLANPPDESSARLLEAVAALAAPELATRRELNRWFAGRVADFLRNFLRNLADRRRPSFRIGLALAVAVLLFLGLADGEHRVAARAVIEGEVQRAVVAPFDGFVAGAKARAGQRIASGEVLATLDDRDLRLERQKWLSEREQTERKYRDALAKHERANVRIFSAQLAEAAAQLALSEEKLARTQLLAPFDGLVVSGDLSQMLGSPVEKGKVLFEVAPLNAYRVILKVEETDIRGLKVGQNGELMLSGRTGEALPFVVQNISVAGAEEGMNLFRVEARLTSAEAALRPGMEGVGKVVVGQRRLLWIWTHAFFDWLRLKLWHWLP